MLIKILTTLLADTICALVVVAGYRRLSTPYKVIGWYQILSAVVQIAGLILVTLKLPNIFVYSVYGLVSYAMMLLFCHFLLPKKNVFLWLILPVAIEWIIETFINGVSSFPTYFFFVHSMVVIVAFFIILYQSALVAKGRLLANPDFFMALGILIFYGCTAHYLILTNISMQSLSKSEIAVLVALKRVYSNLKAILLCTGFMIAIKKPAGKLAAGK